MEANNNHIRNQLNFRVIAEEVFKWQNVPAIDPGATILRSLDRLNDRLDRLSEQLTRLDAKSDSRYGNQS